MKRQSQLYRRPSGKNHSGNALYGELLPEAWNLIMEKYGITKKDVILDIGSGGADLWKKQNT